MIRVVVYDEAEVLCQEIANFFSRTQGCSVVGCFHDLRDLESDLEDLKADVIVMDLGQPWARGVSMVRTLKRSHPGIRVVIHTKIDDERAVLDTLRVGADGYMLKPTSPIKLYEAVMEAYEDGVPMTPRVAKIVFKSFSNTANSVHSALTSREKDVLRLLVHGMSYKLVSYELEISMDTVRTHIRSIYNKLKVRSKSEAVAKAILNHLV